MIAAIYNNEDEIMLMTREATECVGKVHHRMPVLLGDYDEVDRWLNTDKFRYEDIKDDILNPKKRVLNTIDYTRLGPSVNNIREKTIKCIMSHEDYIK
jgi:putative SOS response-associated peptidase YedK